MNKRQKEILQSQLDSEQAVLKKLKGIYKKALDDVNNNIAALMGRTDTENLQSVIYQLQYQKALKTQINGILDTLNGEQFNTIADYLSKSYEDGFAGVMYDLHGQGIPLIFPIDQDQVVRAIQHDTKLSKSLYDSLGEDVSSLKKRIQNNISRGIAQGSSYADIARNVASGMVGDYTKMRGGALGKAYTIARTEGHRITNEAAYEAQKKAKEKGADVVKQWDAAMDKRTRPSHARVDGEIRELDEPFSNGLIYPGDSSGSAAEVINCRCACLQRARWALDEDELQTLKDRAEYFGLDKTDSFEDFKKKYIVASKATPKAENSGTIDTAPDVSYVENTYGTAHAQSVKSNLQNADPDVQAVWNKYQSKFKTSDANYSGNQAYYSPSSDSVTLNISNAAKGSSYQTQYQVLYHEYGHMTDYLAAREFGYGNYTAFTEVFNGLDANGKVLTAAYGKRGLLGQTAKNEVKELIKNIKKVHGVSTKAEAARILIDEITQNYSLIARSDVSDMLEGAGIGVGYPLGVGHGLNYWKNMDNGKEIFAEIISAETASPESLACIQKYFPETYKVFKSILGAIK